MKRLFALIAVLLLSSPAFATPAGTAHRGGGGAFSGIGGLATGDWVPSDSWTTQDIDDATGVADGAGADSNPFTGIWTSSIQTGTSVLLDTYTLDPIHTLSMFNGPEANHNPALYGSVLNFEYSWGSNLRSGPMHIEHYWQISPVTYRITFAAGGTGKITLGDNYTFTNGAVCRPNEPGSAGIIDADLSNGSAAIKFVCVNPTDGSRLAPVAGNTITACSGACTGPTAGTVSGAPVDDQSTSGGFRPFFWEYYSETNSINLTIERGYPGTAGQLFYWLSAQAGDSVLHLGKGGYSDTRPSRVSIPSNSDAMGYSLLAGSGDIAIDTTNGGTYAANTHERAAHTVGGQFQYTTSSFAREGLSPTNTQCITINNTDATTGDNTEVPLAWWQPVTIVAVGCRNLVRAPATNAVLTIKDRAGNAIPLDSTLTCAANNASMSFVTTSVSDDHSILTSGKGLLIDVTTASSTITDAHAVCFAYKATRT